MCAVDSESDQASAENDMPPPETTVHGADVSIFERKGAPADVDVTDDVQDQRRDQ